MKLFKTYNFKWWQVGILKLALLCIGAAIGAYWNEFFRANIVALIVIAVVASVYMMYVSWKD